MSINYYRGFRLRLSCLFFFIITTAPDIFAQVADSTLFRDDFDRAAFGNSWLEDGSWSIANGSAYNFTGGPGGTLKTTTGFPQTSYILETSAMGFNENYYRYFRFTFGQADLANFNALYEVSYTAWQGGRLTLSRATDNVFYPEVLDEIAVFPGLFTHTWYKFKIAKYQNGLIQVYLDKGDGYDSIPVLEAIDSTYPALGHVGWQVDTDAFPEDFYVDWILASKPGVEKPATREKPFEDSLIAQVSAKSGKDYKVSKLFPGVKQYIDRNYLITSVPEYLKGASFIQTANDDKLNSDDQFLTYFVKSNFRSAIVYVGYDSRAKSIPEWLTGWTKTSDSIGTNDENGSYLDIYSKIVGSDIYPYPSFLGGNLAIPAKGAETNYLVAATMRPGTINLQAEDALLSGAVVATNHQNYNGTGFVDFKNPTRDYIEWTANIDIPGSYTIGFRFANSSKASRSLLLTVNGIDAGIVDFPVVFPPTWSSWSSTSGPRGVFLAHGTNIIRVTAINTSGPNLDELNLTYSSTSLSTSAPTAIMANNFQNNAIPGRLTDYTVKAFPNPFVQNTKIYYHLEKKCMVTLAVYTLQGQQIKLLEKGVRIPGNYTATFNAGKFSKGIYIYRLQTGNNVKMGKLIKQ